MIDEQKLPTKTPQDFRGVFIYFTFFIFSFTLPTCDFTDFMYKKIFLIREM